MRADKLTTKFQEALADAQSLANVSDNAYMEPQHLLVAMLRQEDGPKSLLQRAGVNVAGLQKAAEDSLQRLPQVQGGEQVQPSRDLLALLQLQLRAELRDASQMASLIDGWKNRGQSPDIVPAGESDAYAYGKGAQIYGEYQKRLKDLNAPPLRCGRAPAAPLELTSWAWWCPELLFLEFLERNAQVRSPLEDSI